MENAQNLIDSEEEPQQVEEEFNDDPLGLNSMFGNQNCQDTGLAEMPMQSIGLPLDF